MGPSSRQACTQCRPGTYKPATGSTEGDADFCSECPINQFASGAGSSACQWCARGYETQDTGSTECSPCAVGYYSAAAASSSAASNCVAAPAGSYVNTTAAFSYTLCAVGSFSKEEASDNCDPCPPGQYANSPGSKSCKVRLRAACGRFTWAGLGLLLAPAAGSWLLGRCRAALPPPATCPALLRA